jgi:hypothetical protein
VIESGIGWDSIDIRSYMSVVLNNTVPSSVLKKKHNAIAYHRVREAIAARIMKLSCIKSEENVSDLSEKP